MNKSIQIEENLDAMCDAIADMVECPLAKVDSCVALMMIDGIVPIPECWETECMDSCEANKSIPVFA